MACERLTSVQRALSWASRLHRHDHDRSLFSHVMWGTARGNTRRQMTSYRKFLFDTWHMRCHSDHGRPPTMPVPNVAQRLLPARFSLAIANTLSFSVFYFFIFFFLFIYLFIFFYHEK